MRYTVDFLIQNVFMIQRYAQPLPFNTVGRFGKTRKIIILDKRQTRHLKPCTKRYTHHTVTSGIVLEFSDLNVNFYREYSFIIDGPGIKSPLDQH